MGRAKDIQRLHRVKKTTTNGFTVVEIMVVLAILGVVMAIAAPSYNSMVASQRVRAVAAELHATLLLARSEAIKRGATVRVRPADDEEWADGWLLPNPDSVDSDDNPLARTKLSKEVKVSAAVDCIAFSSSGRPVTSGDCSVSPSVNFEFEWNFDSSIKRCVRVDLSGRSQTGRWSPEAEQCEYQ